MEKRLTMFFACLFLSVGMALAQTKVTGTVISQDDGQPIIGAAVKVVGTSQGMLTDVNGRFSLTLPAGKNDLEISYLRGHRRSFRSAEEISVHRFSGCR